MPKFERNLGRTLVYIIESKDTADRAALQSLLNNTRAWVNAAHQLDTSDWPADVGAFLQMPPDACNVMQRTDMHGEIHRFVVLPCADHDLVVGVSSRRAINDANHLTQNVASNVFLELIGPPKAAGAAGRLASYGLVLTPYLDRIWRTQVGAAHIQGSCIEGHVVIRTPTHSFDPRSSDAGLLGAVQGALDQRSGDDFVYKSTTHRRAGHLTGISKFPRSKTHTALAVSRPGNEYRYDIGVVRVLRAIATLRLQGWSFAAIADSHAHELPSYELREEADHPVGTARTGRSRSERNQNRVRCGRHSVPLKYLEDGSTPNPHYLPETMADLSDPASAIRNLFTGPSPSARLDRNDLPRIIEEELGGLAPNRAYLQFFADGIYRRLHRDPDLSGRTFSRWRWIEYDLGPVDEHGCILTPDQARRLADMHTPREITSAMPLAGLFTVDPPETLYTNRGILRADDGNWKFRTAHNAKAKSGYRIYAEPHGVAPHSGSCPVVAWLPASDLHVSVAQTVIDALDEAPTTTVVTPPRRTLVGPDELEQACRAVAEETIAFDAAVQALASPDLSDRQRRVLQEEGDAREAALELAEQNLSEAQGRLQMPDETQDVTVALQTLPDALAALSLGTALQPALADAVRRLLTVVLRGPTMKIDPSEGLVRWSAVLELETDTRQTLRIAIAGAVPNHGADTWLGGPGGMVWAGMSFHDAWERLNHKTPVGLTTPGANRSSTVFSQRTGPQGFDCVTVPPPSSSLPVPAAHWSPRCLTSYAIRPSHPRLPSRYRTCSSLTGPRPLDHPKRGTPAG